MKEKGSSEETILVIVVEASEAVRRTQQQSLS